MSRGLKLCALTLGLVSFLFLESCDLVGKMLGHDDTESVERDNPVDPGSEDNVGNTLEPADGSSTADSTPLLRWEWVDGAAGYRVQVSQTAEFTEPLLIDASNLTTSRYQCGTVLENKRTYYWRVQPLAAEGDACGWSEAWSFKVEVPVPVPVPTFPSNGVLVSPVGPLSWDVPKWVPRYRIEVSRQIDFPPEAEILSDEVSHLPYYLPCVLQEQTPYYWRVRSLNADGVSGDWCSTQQFVLQIPPLTLSSPTDGYTVNYPTPWLSWNPPPGSQKYRVQVSETADFSDLFVVDVSDVTCSSYQLTASLRNQARYYWRVRALYLGGIEGNWSASRSFTVQMPPPTQYDPYNDYPVSTAYPTFSWSTCAGAIGYRVEVSGTTDFATGLIQTGETSGMSSTTCKMAAPLEDGHTYYWRVCSVDTYEAPGSWSPAHRFTVVYPRPSSASPANGQAVLDRAPLLDWYDIPDVTAYQVQVSDSPDFSGPLLHDLSNLTLSEYRLPSPLPMTSAFFWRARVTARTDGAHGAPSGPSRPSGSPGGSARAAV